MLRLARCRMPDNTTAAVRVGDETASVLSVERLSDLLHADDVASAVDAASTDTAVPVADISFLPPVDGQDVWAAGVTYKRSMVARMEESEAAADHYDRVYSADRPELFFKSTAARVVGPGEAVRVRADSRWTVPEPELTLVVSPDAQIVGYTVGNDMSARDIEGENPLYLPQAKTYAQSCAVGPWVTLLDGELPASTIELTIRRGGQIVNRDDTSTDQIHRRLPDLVDWLFRDNDFPEGVLLLTGTGIIPPDDFSLEDGDEVTIRIEGIGQLTNPVVKEGA